MTLNDIVKASVSRANRWHPSGLEEWSPLEWAGAMAGEAGEACNAAKKLKRVQTSLKHIDKRLVSSKSLSLMTESESYKEQVAKEAADTILYALLLIAVVNRDPEKIITTVFNQKSEEYGFPERLSVDHIRKTHNDNLDEECSENNRPGTCSICNLFICEVCGGAEGSLLPSCPGRRLTFEENEISYQQYCDGTGPFEGRKR